MQKFRRDIGTSADPDDGVKPDVVIVHRVEFNQNACNILQVSGHKYSASVIIITDGGNHVDRKWKAIFQVSHDVANFTIKGFPYKAL